MYPVSSSERLPRRLFTATSAASAASATPTEDRANRSRLRDRLAEKAATHRSQNVTAIVGETRFVIGLDFGTTYTGKYDLRNVRKIHVVTLYRRYRVCLHKGY